MSAPLYSCGRTGKNPQHKTHTDKIPYVENFIYPFEKLVSSSFGILLMWAIFYVSNWPCGRLFIWAIVHVGNRPCVHLSMWTTVHVGNCPLAHVGSCPFGQSSMWAIAHMGDCKCRQSSMWTYVLEDVWPCRLMDVSSRILILLGHFCVCSILHLEKLKSFIYQNLFLNLNPYFGSIQIPSNFQT